MVFMCDYSSMGAFINRRAIQSAQPQDSSNKLRLRLQNQNIDDPKLREVLASTPNNVEELSFMSNRISEVGLSTVITPAQTPSMAAACENRSYNLVALELGSNLIGNRGCKYLSALRADNVVHFSLYNNVVESTGLQHLSKAKWNRLAKLWLGQNKISVSGGHHLTKANFKRLGLLYLVSNSLHCEDIYQLLLLQSASMKIMSLRNNSVNGEEKSRLVTIIRQRYTIFSADRIFDL